MIDLSSLAITRPGKVAQLQEMGACLVDSNLPDGDAEPDAFVTRPTTALPALSNPNHRVAIDGCAQALFTCDTHALGPEIILDGSLAGATPDLCLVGAQHQAVGVTIQNFNGPEILVDRVDQTAIGHSVLGGAPGRGNAQDGVRLVGDADGNAIGGPIPWDVVKTNEHPGRPGRCWAASTWEAVRRWSA